MADDVQVVVEDDDLDELPPSPPTGWMAWLGLAGVAVVLVATTLPRGAGDGAPATTFPSIPTVSVPELVGETLEWEPATGFEEAQHIGAVIRFDDSWWALGSTVDGLAAWTSSGQPGQPWKLAARPGGDEVGGWVVSGVEVLDGALIVAAGPENGLTGGALFQSVDGVTWTQRQLPATSPRLSTVPFEVIPTQDGVIVRGFGVAGFAGDVVADVLPDDLRRLYDVSQVEFAVSDTGQVVVFVLPGIEVARFQAEELTSDLPRAPERSPQVWKGPSLDDLTVSREEWFPWDVQSTPDGSLLAPIGIQLAYSDNGEDWEPVGPHLENLMGFVPWRDGAAVLVQGEDPAYWTPDSANTAPLLPDELLVDPTTQFSQVVADDVGLAALAVGISAGGGNEVRTLVAEVDGYELFLTRGLTLELLRNDDRVWTDLVWNTPVALEGDGMLQFGEPPDAARVSIEDWLDALRRHTPSQVANAQALRVVHSSDGHEWSSTSWAEISGMDSAVPPTLFATDDFVFAVDQTRFPLPYMNGAWLGRPGR